MTGTIIDVTAAEVWAQMLEDEEFIAQPEPLQQAMKPFVEQLPTVLADFLDKPVTIRNLAEAKIAYIKYCQANNFVEKALSAFPDEAFFISGREAMILKLQGSLEIILTFLQSLVEAGIRLLDEAGITEEDFMISPKVGLREEALNLYKAGELTIGKLLKLQPMVIFKNTD